MRFSHWTILGFAASIRRGDAHYGSRAGEIGKMGMLLIVIGGLVALYGLVVMLINAFKASLLWGLGSLFIPLVLLVFVIMNWAENMKPFLIYLGGFVLMVVGAMMSAPDVSQQAGSL
jgi:hypothetical protein